MVDIQFVKASDYCESVVDGTHDSPKPCDEGFYLITSKHLLDYEINFASAYKISQADYNLITKRSSVKQWDILLSMIGTVGRVYIERNSNSEYACKNVGIFKCGGDRYKALWLYYVLKSPYCKQYISKVLAGSTQSYISLSNLRAFPVPVIADEKRNRIIEALSTLDDKIEVNNKLCVTLGDISQEILQHFSKSYSSGQQPLKEIAIIIDCLHSKKPEYKADGSGQLIQLGNIRDDGFLDLDALKYMISDHDYKTWTKNCEIGPGDCVITNVGRIGAVSQAPYYAKAAMGRNMTCIRLKKDFNIPSFLITALLSKEMRRQIDINTDVGTIMGALNVKNIPNLLIPKFDQEILEKIESTLRPLRDQIENTNLETVKLRILRDSLLPKLLSGEIELKDQ